MMDDDVHAWARERLADVIYECDDDADAAADAVLAVLPELLTDERVVEAVARNHSHNVIGDFVFDGNDHGDGPNMYRAEMRAALAAAAEALAGVS